MRAHRPPTAELTMPRRQRPRNSSTVRFTSSGRSSIAPCEAPGTIHSAARGIARASCAVCSGRTTSCSPAQISVRARIEPSSRGREVRLRAPHRDDLVHRGLVVRGIGRQVLRRPARVRRAEARRRVAVAVPLDVLRVEPVGREVGAERDEVPHALRVVDGEVEPDDPAVAPAHDVGLPDAAAGRAARPRPRPWRGR